jgi:hypothetical protein
MLKNPQINAKSVTYLVMARKWGTDPHACCLFVFNHPKMGVDSVTVIYQPNMGFKQLKFQVYQPKWINNNIHVGSQNSHPQQLDTWYQDIPKTFHHGFVWVA